MSIVFNLFSVLFKIGHQSTWLCSHVRTVVSTLGGKHGAAGRADQWRHLYSGFTVWVSQTEATGQFFRHPFRSDPCKQNNNHCLHIQDWFWMQMKNQLKKKRGETSKRGKLGIQMQTWWWSSKVGTRLMPRAWLRRHWVHLSNWSSPTRDFQVINRRNPFVNWWFNLVNVMGLNVSLMILKVRRVCTYAWGAVAIGPI